MSVARRNPTAFEKRVYAALGEIPRGRVVTYAALAAHIIENPMLNGTTLRLDGAVRMQAK